MKLDAGVLPGLLLLTTERLTLADMVGFLGLLSEEIARVVLALWVGVEALDLILAD